MLTSYHITILFLSLGVLLFAARGLGELAQRFHQPAVLGELMAGVLLGPTVLGALAPELSLFLFPLNGLNATALDTIGSLAIALFLMVAGMVVIGAAILNDIIGWLVFAIVLSLLGNPAGNAHPIVLTITLTLAFTGLMLTLGRGICHDICRNHGNHCGNGRPSSRDHPGAPLCGPHRDGHGHINGQRPPDAPHL